MKLKHAPEIKEIFQNYVLLFKKITLKEREKTII